MAKVTERFTRTDADTIRYQFTVNDPKTWVKPFSGEYNMAISTVTSTSMLAMKATTAWPTTSGARATEKK